MFGDLKIADNASYNAQLLSDLVKANDDCKFNKPILLQAASLIEVVSRQIFYRAKNYNIEGVPNISEEDRQKIETKNIDNFSVIIDNLEKYSVLDGLGAETYNELHQLRKFRNKIHIHLNVEIAGVSRDEGDQFNTATTNFSITLNWNILSHLAKNYARPEAIGQHVPKMHLPRLF